MAHDEWVWDNTPSEPGWYATLHCWDEHEGMFPDAHWYGGLGWSYSSPICAYHGPFDTEDAARAWAADNDPEF